MSKFAYTSPSANIIAFGEIEDGVAFEAESESGGVFKMSGAVLPSAILGTHPLSINGTVPVIEVQTLLNSVMEASKAAQWVNTYVATMSSTPKACVTKARCGLVNPNPRTLPPQDERYRQENPLFWFLYQVPRNNKKDFAS